MIGWVYGAVAKIIEIVTLPPLLALDIFSPRKRCPWCGCRNEHHSNTGLPKFKESDDRSF